MFKIFFGTAFLISMLASVAFSGAVSERFDRVFDDYGNICWEDEKSRLDNFAVALQNDPSRFVRDASFSKESL